MSIEISGNESFSPANGILKIDLEKLDEVDKFIRNKLKICSSDT